MSQNVPSIAGVAAGAFGFLTLIQVFDEPERYGESSFFETIPSRPSLQIVSAAAFSVLDVLNPVACGTEVYAAWPCVNGFFRTSSPLSRNDESSGRCGKPTNV